MWSSLARHEWYNIGIPQGKSKCSISKDCTEQTNKVELFLHL